jgi:putative ABC transport system substrate-binding protein
MQRRDFLAALAGIVATKPGASLAQQSERVAHIGVLMHASANEPEPKARLAAFVQGLQEAGWSDGRNLRVDTRWSTGDQARLYKDAVELMALHPDAVLAGVGATTPALQQASRVIPIIFAQGIDPVGAGYVESLNGPGGNATGFIQLEFELAGKWLELLKEVAPGVTRAAVLREPGTAGVGQWTIIQAVSHSLGVELRPIRLETTPNEIERAISAFAQEPNSALVVVVSAAALTHRDLIIALAARYRLPTVYPYRELVAAGGLITYSADITRQYKRAAGYVDRILKGENPANMPVQAPTKYDLVINLKTAKALGLTLPGALLARADEVIE